MKGHQLLVRKMAEGKLLFPRSTEGQIEVKVTSLPMRNVTLILDQIDMYAPLESLLIFMAQVVGQISGALRDGE